MLSPSPEVAEDDSSRYFLTVFLWIHVSLVVALMDRPLRLAAWITFHLAICKGAGFLGTEVAFLLTLGQPRPWLRSFSSACSLSSEASTLSRRLPRPLRSGGFSVRATQGPVYDGLGVRGAGELRSQATGVRTRPQQW